MWFKKARKVVDFGANSRDPIGNVSTVDHKTPFGIFQVRSDGTFIDVANRNQWIRAPWGMKWTGSSFAGVPWHYDWYDATKLFGRGADSYYPGGGIRESGLEKSEYRHGYKDGHYRVIFMGADDWRLPTAADLETLHFAQEGLKGWGYTHDEKSGELRQALFPFSRDFGFWTWSATKNCNGIAWAIDGTWPPGDYKMHQDGLILLIRRFY